MQQIGAHVINLAASGLVDRGGFSGEIVGSRGCGEQVAPNLQALGAFVIITVS